MSRFAIRTIKDGRVTIHGRTYRPDEQFMAYDGRLDGMRYAFGIYTDRVDAVALWGSEEMYRAARDDEERFMELWESMPECVDGYFNWAWWPAEVRLEQVAA